MRIVAQSLKIGDILRDGKIYAIPIFQRSFSWEDQQIMEFWEDIITVYKENPEEYFLGSMVFSQHEIPNKVKILDGQQRLATILLFLAALRDILKQTPIDKAIKRVEVINNILYTTDPITLEQNCKLELNREDRIFFERLIVEGIIPDIKYTSHKLIKKAYEYFRQKIKEEIEKEGENFVRGILKVLLDKLVIIKIWVPSEVDAHTIFETLNDRGLELSIADLVKNYLFSISGDYLEIAIEKWKEIVDAVGDYKVSKFLRHFWISRFELVRKEEVYKKLRNRITPNKVRGFIEELASEAIIYSNLQSPSHEFWNNMEIENLLEELNILKVEQVYVLLLAAFRKFYENGEREKFKSLLQKIISFTFRWSTICGLNPNELERLYSSLAIRLRKNEINFEDLIEELKKRVPTDEEFTEKFKEKEIKNNRLAKYILLRLNNFLLKRAGKKEIAVDMRRVNLEHIIPKKPDREWINFFQEKGIKKWDELIHKIGNLTILLKEYNRRIANKFFTRKKEMYKKSILPLNEKLKTYTEFGPSQIAERAQEMAEIAKTVWKI